ncbi:bifunctional diguanylate cyclase/phosphodiesterase [Paraglaciecola hydrolytica]|uniref:Diguanylate cyclase n=1 Tax=Paraglaciecola hydrolytica TaxID=1799789 RepID=A0A136A6G4_9ALTE|nr:EAL domain-containing protein [Paraglaciecola hydrolytica]KXI30816.1 diguanylate cyclase [Paraglaciecola hydrolytica]
MTSEQNLHTNTLTSFAENANVNEMYLRAVFNNMGDPIFVKDQDCRLLLVNDAFCSIFSLPREEIIGKTLAEKVPASEREHFLAIDLQVLKEGNEILCEETLTTNGQQTKNILTRKNRFIDAYGNYFLVGVIHDITQRKQTEQREKSRTKILELITSGEPLNHILAAIVGAVEQENPNMLCSILLLDDAGKHLLSSTASSLPGFYTEAIHGIEIGLGVGSCGTAAYTNKRVIVDDIQNHPYWAPYKELAQSAGLGSCWSEPIRSVSGKVLGTFAIYHHKVNHPSAADLAVIEQTASLASIAIEKKQAQEKLTRAASVFTHAHEGIMLTDANSNIIEVNASFSRMTGYSEAEVLGKNPRLLQSKRQSPEFYVEMWDTILTHGYWRGEIWNRRKNGELYAEMLTISAVKNSAGVVQHYVSLSTDITPMKHYQSQLERIAHYDTLTNLPNRELLADRLSQAMAQCQRHQLSLAVAFMDLDGFKAVNDNHGHDVGDELLIAVSQRMKEALREGDTLARIGGDEFIAIIVDIDKFEDSELVLKRLLKAAQDPILLGETRLQVSASIGVTLYPQDGVNAEQLMRHADQAMYVAKQAGKNCYHLFDTAKDSAIHSHRKNIDDIYSALALDQFVLHYQPKVNMHSGAVIGVEALIRWQHPVRGLVPPLAFLPVIEEHVVSLELGEWVIDTALTQIKQWRLIGLNLPISVNISAYQLQQTNFTTRLAALLAAHPEVPANFLELEILESSALHDTNQVSETMTACHQLGVSFALDDFGTGYSSLTYLKRLPAHLIKIDQSFVRDMLEDADDLAIVKGVVGLAKAFQRQVIAEGVETPKHGKALLQLGCELAQGYGIARPMPGNEIVQWITTWKTAGSWLE